VYVAGADLVEAAEKQQWDRLQVRRPLEAFFASSVVRREPSCWGLVSRRARRRRIRGKCLDRTYPKQYTASYSKPEHAGFGQPSRILPYFAPRPAGMF
jgi:hypothetical protein